VGGHCEPCSARLNSVASIRPQFAVLTSNYHWQWLRQAPVAERPVALPPDAPWSTAFTRFTSLSPRTVS
jgi:hypothetical protein